MAVWDSTRVKAQLRLTAQRLGQIQDRLDAQGQITKGDVTTLLRQRNVALARAKAQKLIREDIYGDLLQTLEMQVGILLEHFSEFERIEPPSPIVIEAASSVIYAAPHVDSKDLQIVKDLLAQRLGPDFVRSALGNQDNYVAARVIRDLSAHPPSAAALDSYLYSIAKSTGIHWMPDFQPHEKVDQISALLDPASIPVVDISRLRLMCSHGLPEYPPWLRPRVWRLLLGTLPAQKANWQDEGRKQRENYYDLVRRLLEPIDALPPPTTPLTTLDASLVDIAKELSHVPRGLLNKLEEEPEASENNPFDDSAPADIKIPFASALDTRLKLIREHEAQDDDLPTDDSVPEIRLEATPEIRLETLSDDSPDHSVSNFDDDAYSSPGSSYLDAESAGTPEISLSAPDSPTSAQSGPPTTLLASRGYSATGAHPKHESALLRLLYVHSALNPAHRSPQIASLLVPLYAAFVDEADPHDYANIEADAFWLFEAMVGEFSELEDADGGNLWMQKLSQRLTWADTELAEDLQAKGLDPALPHYSYRWLTTLLTHTLPLSAVLMVWDALFARPSREKTSNPRLDYLLDICASMLICARGPILHLGKPHIQPLNLWGDESTSHVTLPTTDREMEEAFMAGVTLLQNYPLESVGGVEKILQFAYDLAAKRELEAQSTYTQTAAAGLGARLRSTGWWNTSTTAPAQPPTVAVTPAPALVQKADEDSDDDSTDDSEDDTDNEATQTILVNPQRVTLGSRLANTVWKGITNQAAMEPPPTPLTPSPAVSPTPSQPPPPASEATPEQPSSAPASNTSFAGASIWTYAGKLRDSDAAATLAKVSTNWRVKALDAWSKRNSQQAPNPAGLSPSWTPSTPANRSSLPVNLPSDSYDQRRSSLPEPYSPPERPAFFRPVRDSFIADPRQDPVTSPTGSEMSVLSENDLDRYKRGSLSANFHSFSRSPSPRVLSSGVKSGGPRPLLLNSNSLITHSRSPTLPASVIDKQFAEVVRSRRPSSQRAGSQSSVSSISPLESAGNRSTVDMSNSRVVPIGRKGRSPMATSRREGSISSAASSPGVGHHRLPTEVDQESDSIPPLPTRQFTTPTRTVATRDSTTTVDSFSSPPHTPDHSTDASVRVVSSEPQRGSVVLTSEFGEVGVHFPSENTPKITKKHNNSLSRLQIEDSSDSSAATQVPTRAARVRSKRYPPRLGTMRVKDSPAKPPSDRASSPNTLAAPEWNDDNDAPTPKATSFDQVSTSPGTTRRTRKLSGDGRTRKVSADGSATRVRKVSTERREAKHKRESADGDDEGYDDLLSAYESEDV